MGFKLKSGNKPLAFKNMGSSPAKVNNGLSLSDGTMQAASAKKDPRYGKMSKQEYKTEVNRQVKSKKETGSYDAMNTAKNKVKMEKMPIVKPTLLPKGEGLPDKLEVAGEFTPKTKEKKGNWFQRLGKANEKLHKFRNSEEGARFKDTMGQAANIIGENKNFSTDNEQSFIENKRSNENHAIKMENVERDRLKQDTETERTQQLVQLAKDAKNKTQVLDTSVQASVNEDGEANMSSASNSSGERYKNQPV